MGSPSFLTDSWDTVEKVLGLGGKTTANITGMTPAQAKVASGAATTANIGAIAAVFGGINSAIGGYYAAKSQQYQIQSQASSLQFQSGIDAINARQEEINAQSTMEASKTQVQQYTMRAGQQAAQAQVSTAARGVDLSSGSAVALRASDDLVKQMDVLTINSNATRAAWAQRTQAVNDQNSSLLTSVGASNLRASADSISPVNAAATSLLGSATNIAWQWNYKRKLQLATAGSF